MRIRARRSGSRKMSSAPLVGREAAGEADGQHVRTRAACRRATTRAGLTRSVRSIARGRARGRTPRDSAEAPRGSSRAPRPEWRARAPRSAGRPHDRASESRGTRSKSRAISPASHVWRCTPLVMAATGDLVGLGVRPERRPHPARDLAVQLAHRVDEARRPQRERGHVEERALAAVVPAERQEILAVLAELTPAAGEVRFDELEREGVVAGRHRRVRREHRRAADLGERRVERHRPRSSSS